jgi:hypothetical protein
MIRNGEVRRGNKLNNFIFFLSSLTFISVLADITSTVDYMNALIPSPVMRFSILIAIPAFIIFGIWKIYVAKK